MTSPIYDRIGRGYATTRRPDPRIARRILDALGGAERVLNVGAGAGSYEPEVARVVAVEPSGEMIAQRASAAPVVRATAEALPFAPESFDAAMAVLTIHHWGDWRAGVAEMQRVTTSRVVFLTWDTEPGASFWLLEYFPGILELDRRRFPPSTHCSRRPADGRGRCPCRTIAATASSARGGASPLRTSTPACAPRCPASCCSPTTRSSAAWRASMRTSAAGAWERRFGALRAREALDLGYRVVAAEVA